MATPVIYPNSDGQVILYDGNLVYILDLQFSTDGINYWESKYISESHLYEKDGVTLLEPHKYLRFKKSGSTIWEQPAKFIGDDGINGDSPEIRIEDNILQWKLSQSTEWVKLYDLEELRGEQGHMGQGWAVDQGGALDVRPECCSDSLGSCKTCNPNSVNTCNLSTYLSLGNHKINEDDILNETTYWHSVDGITWVQTTNDNLGEYVTAWQGVDSKGTSAYSVNSQGQIISFNSLVNPYISKGKVYVCADNLWTEIMNIVTPTGYVKTSANDGLQFLEAKVDRITLEAYDSGVGYNDNIRIADDGVNEFKIIDSAIGDGLDGGSGAIITADPTDFIGFGLREYISDTDGLDDIQVFVDDVIGDGLISYDDSVNQVDGEDRNLARVNVDDIISPTANDFTGLETSTDRGVTETDGFDNIYIKDADCLESDIDGLNVRADELTINAEGLDELIVTPTDSNTLGIQAKHLHANTVDTNKGLQKGGTTTEPLEVKPDTTRGSIGFNATGEVHVPDNGIQGLHLNDNTCDNTKGVEISNDTIIVKVDDTTIQFNGSGELEVIEAYIQSLIDAGVASLVAPGEASMTGDIVFNASNNNNLISISVAGSGAADGTITYTSDVDESALTTFITNVINSIVTDSTTYARLKDMFVAGSGITITPNDGASTLTIAATATPPVSGSVISLDGSLSDGSLDSYARADHKHSIDDNALTIAKTAGLQAELNKMLKVNTVFGNMRITNNGLELRDANGDWHLLMVTVQGGLDAPKI